MKHMFNKEIATKVHCEITGEEVLINQTTALVRINGIIAFKNLRNPKIDLENKIIHADGKPSLKFYSEIYVPEGLKDVVGPIYSIIDDADDIESSSAIFSEEGKKMFSGQGLLIFEKYLESGAEVIRVPDTMFHTVIDTQSSIRIIKCENWNINYKSVGSKYRFKNIRNEMKIDVEFGNPMPLPAAFDVAISDCTEKNKNGSNYMFSTDKSYQKINLCSNESAVDFCKKNDTIVFYNDFLNKGKLRLLTSYTERINRNMKNPYLFRSSNI